MEEQEITTTNVPYKSNYSLGIVYTVFILISVAGYVITLFSLYGGCVSGIGSLVSFILMMVWFYRSHKNLQSFNTMGLKYSPGWAVGSWFIPILNLFRPFQITHEIWTASDPEASTVSWKQGKYSPVTIAWWISNLVYYGLSLASSISAVSQAASLASGGSMTAAQSSTPTIPILVSYIVYCLLSISVVNLINDRQDSKAESLNLVLGS